MMAMTTGPVSRAVRAAAFAAVCVTTTALGHALMAAEPLPWWAVLAAFAATGPAGWWLTGRERGGLTITGATVLAQLGLHALFDLSPSCAGANGVDAMPERHWAARLFRHATTVPNPSSLPAPSSALRLLPPTELGPTVARPPLPTPMGAMRGMADMAGTATMPGTGHLGATAGTMGHPGHLDLAPSGHGSLGMLLAHTLAAVLCGLWLWRGEAAAFQLARSFAAALFAPLLLVLRTLDRTGPRPPARRVPADTPAVRPHGALLHHVVVRRGPPGLPVCC
uniref:Integral membrane protein n=2 Tax=Streptomyces auratus AGR0001 TaxID=1160718 RepID=J2JT24_9ACTN